MTKIKILLSCVILVVLFGIYRDSHSAHSAHSSHPYELDFTVQNPYVYPVTFDSIYTPFDQFFPAMKITFGNESIRYEGPMLSRAFTYSILGGYSSSITLAPFQSRTVRFNLGRFYNLTRPGIYTVQFVQTLKNFSPIPSSFHERSPLGDSLPGLWGRFASVFGAWWKTVHIATSNSINITITDDDIPTMYSPPQNEEYIAFKKNLSNF